MNNIKLAIIFAGSFIVTGCMTANSITPSSVKQFHSPDELIKGKELNGKDGKGKEYSNMQTLNNALIPYSFFNNLCKNKGAELDRLLPTYFNNFRGDKNNPALIRNNIDQGMGIFKCPIAQPWYVSIQPITTATKKAIGSLPDVDYVTLKSNVISKAEAENTVKNKVNEIKTNIEQAKQNFENYQKQQYIQSPQYIIDLAEKGNLDAQMKLGAMYFDGNGVRKNYYDALRWYKEAAKSGNIKAIKEVGYIYASYIKDGNSALYWYSKAANQGDSEAMNAIGVIHHIGRNGVKMNTTEAMRWYQKAFKNGDSFAPKNIGDMYFNGDGVPRDYTKAKHWYIEAAKKGNRAAEFKLKQDF
ncbi:tetratricopeptide repeat protein [Acinetobacter sp. YH01009]|uniref:tetratricopeptide repeat protein n=1 Tax=Acinetobacter sp. YH01009 TaxID=2601025 RepID=UPI0015D412FB|nr:tetratricopeptide repeat protein [Acinetobacter sp. YH01009]